MGTTINRRFSFSSTDNIASLQIRKSGHNYPAKFYPGFTMVELIVTSAVAALLLVAGVSILNPTLQINKANDTKRKANVAKIQTALELYRSDNGNYPASSVGLNALYQGTPQYLPKNPNAEPKSFDIYTYAATPTGCDNVSTGQCNGYTLITCLENDTDTERDTVSDPTCESPLWSKTVTNP